jgi:photosystem II stability/assembly factor-like uncharacterized protein
MKNELPAVTKMMNGVNILRQQPFSYLPELLPTNTGSNIPYCLHLLFTSYNLPILLPTLLLMYTSLKIVGRMCLITCVLFFVQTLSAQIVDTAHFHHLRWRMIGPHRGGRTVGAVGVVQQPGVFYIGVNNGGVWKTTDYGRTWLPIFDDQPTGSIGDVVVAPSNPNVLYVGTGEGLQRPDLSVGNGMYKSDDAGKTWRHIGLDSGQQIGGLAIDPANENRVFAAVQGHPYGANKERGIYRTTDGGNTWQQVLFIDENTGAIQVTLDPNNADIVYADMWAGRQGPWENGAWNGPNSGLYKSTDGGNTWKKLANGLPTTAQGLARIGFAIAPSNSKRLFAAIEAGASSGIYRSDDAGESWGRIQTDERLISRGNDFAELKVDPKNEDIVYSANIVTWKSVDGGKTWNAFRGAPGGDDYHRIWINPNDPKIMLIASDQGAIITVNGGETFSSWYNQPTAQFYHVITDNAFPYNVYGAQQESGSVGIASRGNYGQITFREWQPVGVEEYGYVAPDPLDANIIYGGKISRFDKRTGQVQNIAPEPVRSGKVRFLRTAPVIFSPVDNKTLFFAGNMMFKTTNGGQSWQTISHDLSRKTWDIPASVGVFTSEQMKTMPRRGVIYTIAPSHQNVNTIWCGTDDGLIHLTRDGGKTWKDVTPPAITSWSKVSIIDASHFDDQTAYAAVNRIRVDDVKPHIYKTHDGGKTWTEIAKGLPTDPINVVREDPYKKGVLYAGSERAVYISFDDGEHWQSLRLNMPATSIRDLVIKDDDIVVGTHGRSFWILDNITSLRQMAAQTLSSNVLFKPQTAMRVRWNMNTDTPIPQEEPAGQNPPDGAMIDYYLPNNETGEVKLEIIDKSGTTIRRYSSNDKRYEVPAINVPPYWIRPQQVLSTAKGTHRFLWDMHYQPLDLPVSFPIAAIYKNTAPNETSPWVMRGTYTVRLTINGQSINQPLTVKLDPRVKIAVADLQQQHLLSLQAYNGRRQSSLLIAQINNTIGTMSQQNISANDSRLLSNMKTMVGPAAADSSLKTLNASFATLHDVLQDADAKPTSQTVLAMKQAMISLNKLVARWNLLKSELNRK